MQRLFIIHTNLVGEKKGRAKIMKPKHFTKIMKMLKIEALCINTTVPHSDHMEP